MNTTAVSSDPGAGHVVPPLRPDYLNQQSRARMRRLYGQILKSSALIGGFMVINVGMGIVAH